MDKLKNFFNEACLRRISQEIKKVYSDFPQREFLKIAQDLENLEMKERVHLIRDGLRKHLPSDYTESLKILLRSLESQELRSFDLWPYTEFVQTFGLHEPKISLKALKKMTEFFTAEWAIRPFIINHPELTWKFLSDCADSSNFHHRRLASEGSRPFVPWGMKLETVASTPELTLGILDRLKNDQELYVRKSVANHLNDFSKIHPVLVCRLLNEWKKNANDEDLQKINWIIRHSLRTLIKDGYKPALKLIGVQPEVKIELRLMKLKKKRIRIGDSLDFEFEIKLLQDKKAQLEIDYILWFRRMNGELGRKVFKLKKTTASSQEVLHLRKSHPLKAISTRKYYKGSQRLDLQVNGDVKGSLTWEII